MVCRFLLATLSFSPLLAQFAGLSLPPSGGNQKASVTQFLGPVQVSIEYSSPAVHGPASPAGGPSVDRRGKIWGGLVPYGLTDQGFGTSKKAPWRAGANENTVFSVSHPVLIEGQPLAAGRYGLHFVVEPNEWTLILSKDAGAWGSFFYNEANDVLRAKLKPGKHEYREYLTYEFPVRKETEARAELQWEDLAVGFKIQVEKPEQIYLSRVRQELTSSTGFDNDAWLSAARYCLQNNFNLEEALTWADYAINAPFVGRKNFNTLSVKAGLLTRLQRGPEAQVLMAEAIALPGTLPTEVHQYARTLQAAGKDKEAFELFQLNAKRFGEAWPTHVGLARGYMGVGNKAKALEHARKALAQAPDDVNRKGLEAMIQSLEK